MNHDRNKETPRVNPSVSIRPELTQRELQILRSLAHGRTDRQIAGMLALSHKTVGHPVEHIMVKLAANNRTHAVVLAMRLSLIRLE